MRLLDASTLERTIASCNRPSRGDGTVRLAEDGQLAPFALVTHFRPEKTVTLAPFATMAELCAQLDAMRTSDNLFYAARLRGRFAHVHNRAACKVGPDETRCRPRRIRGSSAPTT